MEKLIVGLTCAVAVLCGNAEVHRIDDVSYKKFASGDTAAAVTADISATLPEVSCMPSFHLDASQSAGWTVDEADNAVTKIPSLAGNRYLYVKRGSYITGMSVKNPDGTMWNNNDYWTVDAPTLEPGALNGMGVLDFGPMNSRRGLLFDREFDGEGGSTTNQLRNIGTVVAVLNSEEGGGRLLAGGSSGNNGGRLWNRGAPFTYCGNLINGGAVDGSGNSYVSTFEKWSSVLWCTGSRNTVAESAYLPAVNGLLRINGANMIPWLCGYSGGWEVVSLIPNDNNGNANGLGFGVMRQNRGDLSGGMKIAEMIIYPERLSVFETAKVEEYLAAKWLGRVPYGKGGSARLQTASVPAAKSNQGQSLTVDVPVGTRLVMGAPDYGRGAGAAVRKTGEGVLELTDFSRFAGSLNVLGGTVRVASRPIAATVPCEPFFVLDASDKSTYSGGIRAENGTNFVDRVESAAAVNYHKDPPSPLCARRSGTGNAPFLVEDVFKSVNGRSAPAFDFWDVTPNGNSVNRGGYWRIAYSDTAGLVNVKGVTTVIAVVNPRFVGGTLLGGANSAAADQPTSTGCYFERSQQNAGEGTVRLSNWMEPLLGTVPFTRIHDTLTPVDGMTMIDGAVRDPKDGFASPGWQVVAIQVPGSYVQSIGTTYNGDYAGGFMMAEMALFNRALTEEEMRDVSAYMTAKWFNRSLPGYERIGAEKNCPAIQKLVMAEGSSIEVPSGQTLRVGSLSSTGAFTVKGGGRMEVESADFDAGAIEVKDSSTVELTGAKSHEGLSRVADGASMHLDANDSASLKLFRAGNFTFVRSWEDASRRNIAIAKGASSTANAAGAPEFVDGAAYSCAGRKFIGFGGAGSGKSMNFLKPLHSVRVAYIVRVSTYASGKRGLAGGVLLGENGEYSDSFDFLSAVNNNGHQARPFALEAHSVTRLPGFAVYTNGVKVASPGALFYSPDNAGIPETREPVLFELHLPAGAHVSALSAAMNEAKYTGCQAGGEVLLYERELTEREKIQTRNHLMKKWFSVPDDSLAVPPETEKTGGASLQVFDGLVAAEGEYKALAGEGTLYKHSSGVLAVEDLDSFTGTVSVAEGVLKLAKPIPSAEPVLPARDRILARFDASSGVETNASKQVLSWRCAEGSGWSAAPETSAMANYESAELLNGRGIVNIRPNENIKKRLKDPSGNWGNIERIGSVLWLIGSQNGGGFLLGGGIDGNGKYKDNFHRAAKPGTGSYGDYIDDPLLYSGAADAVRTAEFYVNGEMVNPMTTGLSGGWDVITMRRTNTYPNGTSAGGLAWCNTVSDRNGSQRVAEIVIYEGRISEAERDAGVHYLRTKWGLDGEFQKSVSNRLSVVLAEGATLDLNGGDQYVDRLEGEGAVVNGGSLAVGALVADFSSSKPIAYGGRLVVRPGFEIVLDRSSVENVTGFLPLITVSEVDGYSNMREAQFTGDTGMLDGYQLTPAVVDGVLGIKVSNRALILIVR